MRSRILAAALTVAFGLLSIGPALAAGGQFGNLAGQVVSSATKAPIAGASITAKSGSGTYTATTDSGGHFTILGMNVDSYTVTVSANGYQTLNIQNVVVFGGENNTTGTIALSKQLQTIARVTSRSVSSAYQPSQTIDSYTVNQQQILQTTGKANGTNENNVLLSVPGVTMTNAGNVTIRGGAETEVGYQYDGVNFKDPFLGMNGSNGLVSGLGSVQVVEGAGDATQGGVGAGVINVIPQRGSGPGSGEVDLEAGGPNFSHQFAFNYGFSTPDNRFSEYISFTGQRYAPYYGYSTTPVNQYGNYFQPQYEVTNQFTNNFFFNFGKNNHETLQVLYTNINFAGWQGNGGADEVYYPWDTVTSYGSNAATPNVCSICTGPLTGLTEAQYAGLIGLDPGTPSTDIPVPGNQQNFSDNTNFLKLEYDNRLNPSTYFDIRYYNWYALDNSDGSYTAGAWGAGVGGLAPFLQSVGGYTSGFSGDLEKQIGANLTVSLEGQYNELRPIFDLYSPGDSMIQALETGLPDAITPTDWTSGGYFCDTITSFDCGPGENDIADSRIPIWGINYQKTLFQNWGAGLRFQYAATDSLKFDLGVRDEGQNQLWGSELTSMGLEQTPSYGYSDACAAPIAAANSPSTVAAALAAACPKIAINNPFDVASTSWTNSVLHPTELQPRLAVSWEMNRWNSFRFGYGRSAVFQNAQDGGTPFTLYGNLATYENIAPKAAAGTTALCGWAATAVFPCQSALQQLYWQGDNLEAPDAGNGRPALYNNYDISWNHLFRDGWGTRLTPFVKVGQSLPAEFFLNPVLGIFAVGNQGYNKTSGVEANVTTPQTHFGLSGFFTATYQNVLSTTPPFTLDETTVPAVSNASLDLGNLYRAGYVSPLDIRIGALENLKNGITVSPQLEYNIGYPYTVGNLIAACINPALACTSAATGLADIPQVDFGPGITGGINSLIGNAPGGAISTNYYDPANPGSALDPNIAATRGTPGTASNGGYLSHPNLTADLTVQWKHGPNTIGIQMLNLFGNAYIGAVPAINPWYQPVANGVSGPQTGYNDCVGQIGANVRGCSAWIPKSDYAYSNGAYLLTNGDFTNGSLLAPLQPFSFQVYYQRAL